MRTYLNKVRDIAEDIRLGIRTRGTGTTDKPGAVYYASVAYEATRTVLARLELTPTDHFCDIGAGKGRVLALASQYPVAQVIGIEYDPVLVAQAQANVKQLRKRRADIVVREGAAELFDYSDITVAYCFNAVEADILDLILAKIRDDRDGRPFRIAFVMESPAQAAVFAEHGWLARYDAWTDVVGHPITFYRAAGPPRARISLAATFPLRPGFAEKP